MFPSCSFQRDEKNQSISFLFFRYLRHLCFGGFVAADLLRRLKETDLKILRRL